MFLKRVSATMTKKKNPEQIFPNFLHSKNIKISTE